MTATEIKFLRQEIRCIVKETMAEVFSGMKDELNGHQKSMINILQGFGILDSEEEFWTKKDLMVKFGVGKSKIESMMREGILPFVKLGNSKQSCVKFRPVDARQAFTDDRN